MGQKINPIGLRLGINRTWDSRWYDGKNEYGKIVHEDDKIREELHKELVGNKFGEFSPTRTYHGHSEDKKNKKARGIDDEQTKERT